MVVLVSSFVSFLRRFIAFPMAEDVCEEYKSSLADLTFNSKPHINMLTILAEENLQYATDIVKIIEAQIAKVLFPRHFTAV